MTVCIVPGQTMLWGGNDVPCAQAYLMSLGGLGTEVNSKISSKLAELLKKHLKITAEGYMIGYDGDTF